MPKPDQFFQGIEERRGEQRERSGRNYQLKILKTYFPSALEGLNYMAIYSDRGVMCPLAEVARQSGVRLLNMLRMELLRVDAAVLISGFFKSDLWKRYGDLLLEEARCLETAKADMEPEVGLVFPVAGMGDWIVHNFGNGPDPVKGSPRVLYPGDKGLNITVQQMASFRKEFIK